MISDEQFEKAKEHLFQDSTITLLHETRPKFIDGILSDGLNLNKSYNGEISRVAKVAKSDEDIKNYRYYFDNDPKAIVVISIPKEVFGSVNPDSFCGELLLNCITKKTPPYVPSGVDYHPVPHERLASIIPLKWINGIFDQDNNFIPNPKYILRQNNSQALIAGAKAELFEDLKTRYPNEYSSMFEKHDEEPNR